ncbi:MAG: hypothetical protein H6699_07650 [Myxococcales bacterium]|nr:hypothetical protein [Myxococcales bacterium]
MSLALHRVPALMAFAATAACGTAPTRATITADATSDPAAPDAATGGGQAGIPWLDATPTPDAAADADPPEADAETLEDAASSDTTIHPPAREVCANGEDDDGDGEIDCDDIDCALDSLCAPAGDWALVAAGGQHSCGVRPEGEVVCWGMNVFGEIGASPDSGAGSSVVDGLRNPRSLGLGFLHSCALTTDGALRCWGANGGPFHNFGSARTSTVSTPVAFGDVSDARQVALGENHGCVLLADQTLECWGMNAHGALGDGTTQGAPQNRLSAVVGLGRVVEVSVGFGHTCARDVDGAVYCWGANGLGELGDGTTTSSSQPQRVPELPEATDLGVGAHHSCAVDPDGSLWCWGWGDREYTNSAGDVPRRIDGLPEVTRVVAGGDFTCVLSSDQDVWCWGGPRSSFGTEPVRQLQGGRSMAAGSAHVCVLLEGGFVTCLGANNNGQLNVPVRD